MASSAMHQRGKLLTQLAALAEEQMALAARRVSSAAATTSAGDALRHKAQASARAARRHITTHGKQSERGRTESSTETRAAAHVHAQLARAGRLALSAAASLRGAAPARAPHQALPTLRRQLPLLPLAARSALRHEARANPSRGPRLPPRAGTAAGRRGIATSAAHPAALSYSYSAAAAAAAARRAALTAYQAAYQQLPVLPWERLGLVFSSGASGLQAALTSLLGSLVLVAPQLPRMLGLLAADMVARSPWLGGSPTTAHAEAISTFYSADAVPGVGGRGAGAGAASTHAGWVAAARAAFAAAVSSLRGMLRLAWLALLFLPVVTGAARAVAEPPGCARRARWLRSLRVTLERAGPAFIKWGQWAATRHDLFPADVCTELERLHSQAPAHAYEHTRRAIESAFGLPADELFECIDQRPVASGSIGQIHRARLSPQGATLTGLDPGCLVAVKVRHPGVDDAIERDFRAMVAVAALLPRVMPAAKELRLDETLKQFAAPLREQVDLSREARNLFRFNHNFRHTRNVTFPTPLYPLVAPDVLVESFEPGRHITDYIAAHSHPYSHRLAELGSGTMLQMMLVDNLIHSDLHPGNILVRLDPPEGALTGCLWRAASLARKLPGLTPLWRAKLEARTAALLQPRIVLLDVGMATELTPEDQGHMVQLFKAFAVLDGGNSARAVLAFSGPDQRCPDPEAFVSMMDHTFNELRLSQKGGWEDTTFSSGADALSAVLEAVRQHHVTLPPHICAVVVTTLVLEGWSNKLDPTHSVLHQVQNMFEPSSFRWHDRIGHVVDAVVEREDTATAMA